MLQICFENVYVKSKEKDDLFVNHFVYSLINTEKECQE